MSLTPGLPIRYIGDIVCHFTGWIGFAILVIVFCAHCQGTNPVEELPAADPTDFESDVPTRIPNALPTGGDCCPNPVPPGCDDPSLPPCSGQDETLVALLLLDSDNDGRSDYDELMTGTDPSDATDGPDIDGDGIPNGEDQDVDGDEIRNESDQDIDGDGIANRFDPDMDADGLLNIVDPNRDGDGTANLIDTSSGGVPVGNDCRFDTDCPPTRIRFCVNYTCKNCIGDSDCAQQSGKRCVLNVCSECGTDEDCDDRNPCTDDVCSADGHACSHKPNSLPCDDGSDEADCTVGVCSDGKCVSRPRRCEERLPCTPPCSSSDVCVNGACTPKCDNASNCSSGFACRDGGCQDGCFLDDECDDGNECTDDRCQDNATCSHTPNNANCENGSSICCSGRCFEPKCTEDRTCNDRNPCTRDICMKPGTCENHCSHTRICSEECGPCKEVDLVCCDGVCTMPKCFEHGDCAGLEEGEGLEVCRNPGTCEADCVICDDADCVNP